ncbi:unnamed protein product [Didymodactylos carnosus]|uniref:TRPM SLOG domain-containing protein n=1 Tax=Didymodactylos carnosus TaxID=1234261 RepID=A0A8S2F4K0_9BILA|nr:unnamed protein product [Didymodactylos carnosus]CAF4161338.1 unnamed protein product [Didymodactylos carnosus]
MCHNGKFEDWSQAINRLNIKRRTCTTFIPKLDKGHDKSQQSQKELKCCCNRLKREHSWDLFENESSSSDKQDSEWNAGTHTKIALTNAYGRIPETGAPYIRCDVDTKPETLVELMFKDWKMREPRLIMCIIGGAKYFKLNERLEKEFIKGIIQAALIADGWIITSGFKTGVVKLVGDAIYENKLTNPKSEIIAVGKYNVDKKVQKSVLPTSNQKRKGEQELEHNHTHFLLLDDGMLLGYDTGDYRTRLVKAISHYKQSDVPIVIIVVEGGPDTLNTIYNDLRCEIPVVLIDGSGRLPNLLSKFLTRTKSLIDEKMDEKEWKGILDINDIDSKQKLLQIFHNYEEEIRAGLVEITKGSKKSEKEMDDMFYLFLYTLQPSLRANIKSFSLDSDHDLDETIFEAIIEARQKKSLETHEKVNREQLLQLALAWDCIEVAKEHIIKNNSEEKENLFLKALELDRPTFVNTFIKLNFDLPTIFYQYDDQSSNKQWKLKWNRLRELYSDNDKRKICQERYKQTTQT